MQQIILMIHVLVAIFLVVLVLIQHGKGADVGASFGSGASQTVFGSQGSGSFLLKVTCGLAAIFFATSLTLTYMGAQQIKSGNVMNIPLPTTTDAVVPTPITAPVTAPVKVDNALINPTLDKKDSTTKK